MNLRLAVALFSLSFAGCASGHYGRAVKYWEGHDVVDLVAAWGNPTSTSKLENGRTVYTYERGDASPSPTSAGPALSVVAVNGLKAYNVPGGDRTDRDYLMPYWCKTFFEVDASSKIVSSRWKGNACGQ